jgi:beta-galactosidase
VTVTGAVARTAATVGWELVAADGVTVVGAATIKTILPAYPATITVTSPPIHVADAELWSVPRPYLYTLTATITPDAANGAASTTTADSVIDGIEYTADSINTTMGIRGIEWNPDVGLKLNKQRVKMRGFCNHESFAGVGAAIPPRVDLLRLQQLRGVGGNAWRTSHNPPEPTLLDLADRLVCRLLSSFLSSCF